MNYQHGKGTCRVICLKSQYNEDPDAFDENEIKNMNEVKRVISKFDIKNKKQKEFIEHIQNKIGYIKDENEFCKKILQILFLMQKE